MKTTKEAVEEIFGSGNLYSDDPRLKTSQGISQTLRALRDSPRMTFTRSYPYIIAHKYTGDGKPRKNFKKSDSIYMEPLARRIGIVPDYRTIDRAQAWAKRLNELTGTDNYVAVQAEND